MTGLIDVLDYLTTYWKEDDATRRTKCKPMVHWRIRKDLFASVGIELLAQVVTPSQPSLDSPTSKLNFLVSLARIHL